MLVPLLVLPIANRKMSVETWTSAEDWITFPTKTESTTEGSTLPASNADFVAIVAKSVAERCFNDPPNDPNGVRFAATIKIFCIIKFDS
eukprot:scaffold10581_cov155-Chaetoceros_neogracile.AAC.1